MSDSTSPSSSSRLQPTLRIPYKTVNDHSIHLEVYYPSPSQIRPTSTARGVPLVCWIHGGGFFDGAASDWSDLNLIPTLERGWAFVSVEYRLVPQVGLEEQVEDVKDAVRFVREELGERMGEKKVDGKRVAVSGSSAGAALALFASYTLSPPPLCVFSLYGGSDLSHPSLHTPIQFPSGPIPYSSVSSHLSPSGPIVSHSPAQVDFATLKAEGRTKACFYAVQEGKTVEMSVKNYDPSKGREAEELKLYIARELVRNKEKGELPPTVLVHGTEDLMVPCEISRELFEALREKGVDTELIEVEGANHGFDLVPGAIEDGEKRRVFERANEFMAKCLEKE